MDHQESWIRIFIISICFTIVLSGCSGGSATIRYYMIDPVSTSVVSQNSNNQLSIEIMDVNVPQYLERFNLVTRGNENQLYLAEFHQWGDNFRKNLLRTMASNLTSMLGTNDIGTPINRTMSTPDYRVQVHIEQFERNYDGHVSLIARWQVSTGSSSRSVTTHKADLSSSATYAMDEYENIVSTMKDLFGQLSGLIADSINAIEGE